MTISIALPYSLIRCLDNVGETIFNLFAPGCAGASHTPWLVCLLVNSTATDSYSTGLRLAINFYFVGSDGIAEY